MTRSYRDGATVYLFNQPCIIRHAIHVANFLTGSNAPGANKKFLLPLRARRVDADTTARLLAVVFNGMAGTEEPVGAIFLVETERRCPLPALWHLIVAGRLCADLDQPLPPETIVCVLKERVQ